MTAKTLAEGAARLAGLPLVVHELQIAGRDWAIEAVADQSALTQRAEEFTHFPFGLLLWDAAPVLAGELAARPAEMAGRSVLELGCGTGLAGLVAASLGARVLQTDHGEEALALSTANATRNAVPGVAWAMADWRNWNHNEVYDLIIGSDVVYDVELHNPLMAILSRNLAPHGQVLLTDPGRTAAPAFLSALEREGWTVERRRKRVPALVATRPGETVVVTLIEARR